MLSARMQSNERLQYCIWPILTEKMLPKENDKFVRKILKGSSWLFNVKNYKLKLTFRDKNSSLRQALKIGKITSWLCKTKMAQLELPDETYNWIKDFFDDRSHCTKYSGQISTCANIQASVIQGSGLGPATYLVAADLRPVHRGNKVVKFADDTYVIVPAENSLSLIHI